MREFAGVLASAVAFALVPGVAVVLTWLPWPDWWPWLAAGVFCVAAIIGQIAARHMPVI